MTYAFAVRLDEPCRLILMLSVRRSNDKYECTIYALIVKILISSIVTGLKNSYFPLIHLPNCYRTICYWTVIGQFVIGQVNKPIAFKVVV